MPTSLHRWLVFNSVGAMGFAVQLAALSLLAGCFGWSLMPATALAVEAAVIHNFFWHERWTWADRCAASRAESLGRFLRFNLTNGALSILGNLVFMCLFMNTLPINYLTANMLAILACSILNFVVSDRLVFRGVQTIRGCRGRFRLLSDEMNHKEGL